MNKPSLLADLTLIQISDTHLMADAASNFVKMNPEQSFLSVLADIQQHYPHADALLHTGDLAQEACSATYQRYLQQIQALHMPYFQVPGNHDDVACFPFYQQHNAAHAIDLGTWSLVLLNSAVTGQVDGWVDEAQLQQLEQILAARPQQYIVIACHHHPFAMQSHWIDQHKLKNSEALTDVLGRHQNVKLVLFGHVHQESCNTWQQISFLSTPSTCVQFKPKSTDFALGHEAPGYRVLQLKSNGSFSTQVHRLTHLQQNINVEISGY